MTYKILTDTNHVISRSGVRTALKFGPYRNLRADPISNDTIKDASDPDIAAFRKQFLTDAGKEDHDSDSFHQNILKDIVYSRSVDTPDEQLPTIKLGDIVGRTFISNPDENGEQRRSQILEAQVTGETTADGKDAILRFKCKHGNALFEEVVSYNKMLEWVERDKDKDDMYKIEAIVSYRKAILPTSTGAWEVKLLWANGEVTWECASLIYQDDPLTLSLFARENNLLETAGWK